MQAAEKRRYNQTLLFYYLLLGLYYIFFHHFCILMIIKSNVSLQPYNTFGVDAVAKQFIEVNSVEELLEVLIRKKDIFILGGGSNILLTKNIEKPVIFVHIKGIEILDIPPSEEDNQIYIKVKAGENWHAFVMWCLDRNYGGLENLSLIPGNVGAAPIQNIGAYGVEMKDAFMELEAIAIATGKIKRFKKQECRFGYRNSIFKNELKGKYVITSVTFKLTRSKHKIYSSYKGIQAELKSKNIKKPTIRDISDAVIAIRKHKLPDPEEIGNSGSFFKNPVVSKRHFEHLLKQHPEMPFYKVKLGNQVPQYKIPAGWLIEQCGFKGKRFGDAGVHKNQALVLVNYGHATGVEIYRLAQNIRYRVQKKFDLELETEVHVI